MRLFNGLAAATITATLLSACNSETRYVGDGTIVDNGQNRITGRYIVMFEELDFNKPGKYQFRFRGLPEREFVAGIELKTEDCESPDLSVPIDLIVKTADEEVVIKEHRSLADFTWGYGRDDCQSVFGYVRGDSTEVIIDSGDICNRPIYTGADYGRGTYFVAKSNREYVISLTIGQGESEARLEGRLKLEDNGHFDATLGCPEG